MGTDIHVLVQEREGDKWINSELVVFDWRSYGLFGFLANVRNYSCIPPISEARGLPEDFTEDTFDGYHSCSYLTAEELQAFDYDQEIVDHRCTVQIAPNHFDCSGYSEDGIKTTYREFLGETFFDDLNILPIGSRVIFGFDS